MAQLLLTCIPGCDPNPMSASAAAASQAPAASVIFPNRISSDLDTFLEVQQQTQSPAVSYYNIVEIPLTLVQGCVCAWQSRLPLKASFGKEQSSPKNSTFHSSNKSLWSFFFLC